MLESHRNLRGFFIQFFLLCNKCYNTHHAWGSENSEGKIRYFRHWCRNVQQEIKCYEHKSFNYYNYLAICYTIIICTIDSDVIQSVDLYSHICSIFQVDQIWEKNFHRLRKFWKLSKWISVYFSPGRIWPAENHNLISQLWTGVAMVWSLICLKSNLVQLSSCELFPDTIFSELKFLSKNGV